MKITLCVICKNEEKKILRCIQSAKPAVDEMIIVDTGSTDRTVELAKSEGAKVYEIAWENSFSKARNYAINKVDEGWIIFIDADEYFSNKSIPLIRACIEEAAIKNMDCVLMDIINYDDNGLTATQKYIKAFRKDKKIYYVYDIHEALKGDNGTLKMWDASDKLKLLHDGYKEQGIKEKEKRNEKMLLEELKENPNNVDAKFYLMQNYLSQNDCHKVIQYGEEILKAKSTGIWGGKELTYTYMIQACMVAMLPYEQITKYYEEAIAYNATYPDFDYYYGLYLYKCKDYGECILKIKKCLEKVESYNDRIASYATGHIEDALVFEAYCYYELKQYQEAVQLMVKILHLDPERVNILYYLLLIIQETETPQAIGGFLERLYDLNNFLHQIILLKVSKKCGNEGLFQYFYERASDEAINRVNQ